MDNNKKTKIHICDPGLAGIQGHHFDLDIKISKFLVENGYDVCVYSNANTTDEVKRRISEIAPIHPLFRVGPYANPLNYDPYAGELMLYNAHSQITAHDLKSLPEADIWLWPSMFSTQVKACALAGPRAQIAGCVHTPVVAEETPNGQIWWRDALLHAKRASLMLRLGAIEPEHKYEYLPLTTDGKFSVYPTYFDGIKAQTCRTELRTIGFFGHQRGEKGGALVPLLSEKLAQKGYSVIVHDSLGSLNIKNKNNLKVLGFVPDLTPEIAKCDLIVLPYAAPRYKYKASGVMMDALACGVPVVVPFNTAPGRWIERSNAGKQFMTLQLDSIMAAIDEAHRDYSAIAQAAYETSRDWHKKYGLDAFVRSMVDA